MICAFDTYYEITYVRTVLAYLVRHFARALMFAAGRKRAAGKERNQGREGRAGKLINSVRRL